MIGTMGAQALAIVIINQSASMDLRLPMKAVGMSVGATHVIELIGRSTTLSSPIMALVASALGRIEGNRHLVPGT